MFIEIDTTKFLKTREETLKSIYRFSMFEKMFYRSNLWMHSHRVLWMLEDAIPIVKKYFNLDETKARALALVHDDAEIITGDVQLGHKVRMTSDQLHELEKKEALAIEELAKSYPKEIAGCNYKELLFHVLHKDCVEAQLVSYFDKLDAYCESLHEVFAGNISLLRSVLMYNSILTSFDKKFPILSEFLSSKDSPFTYLSDRVSPLHVYIERYLDLNKPYTKKSILIDTDFPFYNRWKNLVMERSPENGLDWLINQREFLDK